MHMYNNAYMYDISIECDFDRPTKKKKKKESASHSILYYLDSWNPRDHGEKKKSLINDSKYRNMSNNQSIRWYRGMFEHNEWSI